MSEPYGTTNKKLNVNGETRTVRYRGFPDLDNVRNYTKTRKHDRIYGSYDYITYDCDYNVYIDGKEYTATRHSTQGSGGTQQTFEYNGVTVGSEKKLAELILSTENNISDSKQLKHNKMKRVKDSGDRICLYGVYTEEYPELNYIEDGIKHSFSDDDTVVDWVVGEMEKHSDITEDYGYSVYDEPTYMRKKVSPDGRFTMYYDGNGTIEIWCDEFAYRHGMSVYDSRRVKDSVKAKSVRKRINDAIDKYFRKDLKNLQAYRRVTDAEGKIKEDVVFLIEDGDVLAVFPNTYGTADRDKDTMECYAHVGQHSTCTYDYANTLKTASKAEYADLYDELTNHVGYKLNVLKKLPSENELKQNGKEIRDSYIKHKRGLQIADERMLARGEEIQYKGKRGTVQYALFHGQEPVVIRWTNEDGSEEFEIPYNEVSTLKIHDSEDDDANIEQVDSDIDENEVTDGCGKKGKKKTKKTADGVKCVKITKRQTKKTE